MQTSWISAIGLIVALSSACAAADDSALTCADDESLCPDWPRDATRVACSCSCEARISLDQSRRVEGDFDACLPPELNSSTASEVQKQALAVMVPSQYSQAVHAVCSQRVVDFLEAIVIKQVGEPGPICLANPVACTCAPKKVWADSVLCREPCREVPCTRDTCAAVFRTNGTIDHSACWCSRVEVCGHAVPSRELSPLCRAELRLDVH